MTKIDIYRKSRAPELDQALFQTPTAEYRGAPFWAWNTRLDIRTLLRQIEAFKAMGFGGAHIHVRPGLATEYLGVEFLELVRQCVGKGIEEGLLTWLYDEDGWPSGTAGGLVTADPQFRAKHLLFTPTPYGKKPSQDAKITPHWERRVGDGELRAAYDIVLTDGYLTSYRRLESLEESPSRAGRVWYAYLESSQPPETYNVRVDVFSPAAFRRFIEVTHERYRGAVGEYFGTAIPAMFTDEPLFAMKESLIDPNSTPDIFLPFAADFFETYQETYGADLQDALPELFWELPQGQASVARWRCHDHLTERFVGATIDQIGAWCERNGLALTGHMNEEDSLRAQTWAIGEAMRTYRSMHIPGIDILTDGRYYNTAKQAQSVAHQYGRSGVMSELYGVTNWDYDFIGHKAQGDWQAALGVTLRVPHLAWVSMAGEAKRDYPASLGCQSPWYKEYPLIEDHFARINTVLTRGRPCVSVAVIHPIESYWLCFGPLAQTSLERDERDAAFKNLTEWLLFGLIDFDFVAESLLPELCGEQRNSLLKVGEMRYRAVVVPGMRTIRSTTLEQLERFADNGGCVLFAGEIPSLVNAAPSEQATRLAARCARVPLTRQSLLENLAPFREITAHLPDGTLADALLHQLRVDGECRHVFLCNTDRKEPRENVSIRIPGDWRVMRRDTRTGGSSAQIASERHGAHTVFLWSFPAHGDLLVTLEPDWQPGGLRPENGRWQRSHLLADPVAVTLSESNVLLLDQAEWRVNNGEWQPKEEILRIDGFVRASLGVPSAGGIQPWADTEPSPIAGTVSLRFSFESDVALDRPLLALEGADTAQVIVDGANAAAEITGWWVDEAIQTVALPFLSAGRHEIIVTLPFHRKISLEWHYLLGDFGVNLAGRHARITEPVRELAFGDWTRQGLPFYAGNITYHCAFEADGAPLALEAAHFAAPLLSIAVDGAPAGKIAFSPFRAEIGAPAPGRHCVDITAFGNRFNAFGPLHDIRENVVEWGHGPWRGGPTAWRTSGVEWSYEYAVIPMGILSAPALCREAG